MRKFIPRNIPPVLPVAVVGVDASVQGLREDKFACVKLDYLQPQQRAQLLALLDGFRVVFDERPGKTTVVEHRIELVPNARPVKQVPTVFILRNYGLLTYKLILCWPKV